MKHKYKIALMHLKAGLFLFLLLVSLNVSSIGQTIVDGKKYSDQSEFDAELKRKIEANEKQNSSLKEKQSSTEEQSKEQAYEPQQIADPFSAKAVTYEDMIERAKHHPYMPNEIVVAMELDVAKSRVAATLQSYDWSKMFGQSNIKLMAQLTTVERGPSRSVTLAHLSLPAGLDVFAAMRLLEGRSGVLWSSPNFYFQGDDPREFIPNDPSYASQYHHTLMQNNLAWDITLGSSSLIIGIADDGVELAHSDLAPNIWANPGEIPGNTIDDDANGYVDDVYGWDFPGNNNDPNHAANGDTHGSHVAGIAAGRTNNAIGISGTAGGCKIMALQFYNSSLPWTAAIINAAYTYATDNGAQIVNTSYNVDGWVGDPVFTAGLQYLYSSGVLHLNSAGNNNQLNPPRQVFDQSIFVASTDASDIKSSFSNYGTGIDVSAPGSSILSTIIGNSYATYSGTSMATPNAAGVAALIWSAHPTWTRDQVAAQLLATADNIDAANPTYIGLLGSGRVNSFQAVTATLPAPKVDWITGLPAEGAIGLSANVNSFTVAFDQVMDPAYALNLLNYEFRGAGPNGTFNDGDDVIYPVTTTVLYQIGTNQKTYTITNTPLPCGEYRLSLISGGLANPFGTALDGNGDGTGGDNYTRTFSVVGNFYYVDADLDGYGAGSPVALCSPTVGYSLLDGDCDDANGSVNPGATEVCNGIDDDCNGTIDDGFAQNYYSDQDNDGYGAGAPIWTCQPGPNMVLQDGDCDDTDAAINPGATEICDGVDNDCDGITDFPAVATLPSVDVPVAISSSGAPTITSTLTLSGYTDNIIDLNVLNLNITHSWVGDLKATLTAPGGAVYTLFDQPGVPNSTFGCSGDNLELAFDDAATLTAADFESTCGNLPAISGTFQPIDALSALNGTSPNGTWTLTIFDYASPDGGSLDTWSLEITTPDLTATYYTDMDGDNYGDPNNFLTLNCDPGTGWVLDNTDCNDNDISIHPGPPQITCPANITVSNEAGQCGAVVSYPDPTVADNCALTGSGQLQTTFTTNNGQDGNMFDVEAINDLVISGFDIHTGATSGTLHDYAVYYKTGTHVGFETNAGAWTLIGSATGVVVAGLGNPTPLPISINLSLTSGQTYAFYITSTDGYNVKYLNGTTLGNLYSSDANIKIFEGKGLEYPFGGAGSTVLSPRVWNGIIHYTRESSLDLIAGLGSGSLFPVGTTTETHQITDLNGNTASCSFTVTVNDIEAPVITCPAPVLVECLADVPPADILLPVTSDNCLGTIVVTHEGDVSDGQTCPETITRTYRATDASGNFAECTQIITVHDITNPTITCPAPVLVECIEDVSAPDITLPVVTDNCHTLTTTFLGTTFATNNSFRGNMFDVTNIGSTAITINSFDVHLQSLAGTNHTVGAWYVTGGGTYVGNESNSAAWTLMGDVPVVSAGIGNPSPMALGGLTIQPGEVFGIFIYQTDGGIGGLFQFAYTNGDNVYSDPNMQISTGIGFGTPIWSGSIFNSRTWNGNIHYTAGSSNVVVSHEGDVSDGQTCPETITRTYRATDACGNFAECTQIISVDDITNPTISCPAPVLVECIEDVPVVDITLPVTSDNCLAPVIVTHVGDVSDNQSCPETITRTYRATDACGNFAECTQIITIDDITDPTISCPPAIAVNCIAEIPVPDINLPVTNDNCGAPLQVVHQGDVSDGLLNPETITRTYRVYDFCGNFAECTQTITVNHPTADAGLAATICEDSPHTFSGTATNYSSVYWTGGTGTWIDGTTFTPTYTPGVGEYGPVTLTLHAVSISPCTNEVTSDVVITVIENAHVYAGADASICESGYQLNPTVTNAALTTWTTYGDGSFDDASDLYTFYTPGPMDVANGSVVLELVATPANNPPCVNLTSSQLTLTIIQDLPTVNIGGNMTICEGDVIPFTPTVANATSVLWTTTGDGAFDNANSMNATYTPGVGDLALGSVEIKLDAAPLAPCTDIVSEQITVTINPPVTATAGADASICPTGTYMLNDFTASNYSSLLWTGGVDGSFDDATILQATYTPGPLDLAAGSVQLCLTANPMAPCPAFTPVCMTLSFVTTTLACPAPQTENPCQDQATIDAAFATWLGTTTSSNGYSTGGSCDLTGSTPDDALSIDTWNRPFASGSCCSSLGPVSYSVYGPFSVNVTGSYNVSSVQDGWDGYLFVYENAFDPQDQTANFVAGDDDGNGGIGTSDIENVTLNTGTEYFIVTTGFAAGDFGSFTNTITGPGTATCGGGSPTATNDNTGAPLATGGSTTVTWSITDWCQNVMTCSATFTVENYVEPAIIFASNANNAPGQFYAGAQLDFCYDQTIDITLDQVLAGTGPFTIEWTENGNAMGPVTVSQGQSLFTGTKAVGTYNVLITKIADVYGCEPANYAQYNATFTVNDEPQVSFGFNNVEAGWNFTEDYCYDETIGVTLYAEYGGTPPYEITYIVNNDLPVTVSGLSAGSTIVAPQLYAPGTYSISVTKIEDSKGCLASATFLGYTQAVITVHAKPVVDSFGLTSSEDLGQIWNSLSGNDVDGFVICTDNNPATHYLLNVEDFAMASENLKTGVLNPFTLDVNALQNSPDAGQAFYAWWAAKGVVTGATGWQGVMW
ncbi:MAG: S8 family serine peptidase, partial [Bacteroidales bacterium]|nr:S8 family serine peptidase [Bacteroidales bacterium]MCF8457948.1 S8 family serine peptidase [Bacteroidales bacterium]